jgi:hypothetical protein
MLTTYSVDKGRDKIKEHHEGLRSAGFDDKLYRSAYRVMVQLRRRVADALGFDAIEQGMKLLPLIFLITLLVAAGLFAGYPDLRKPESESPIIARDAYRARITRRRVVRAV